MIIFFNTLPIYQLKDDFIQFVCKILIILLVPRNIPLDELDASFCTIVLYFCSIKEVQTYLIHISTYIAAELVGLP